MGSPYTIRGCPQLAWIDGKFTAADSPALPVIDQAYLSGMGAFETIRAEGGLPLFIDAHFRRLATSAACFELKMPDIEVVSVAVKELLRRQNIESARIRLTISGAIQCDGVPFRFGGETRTSILAFPLNQQVATPQRLVSSSFHIDSASPLAGQKCTSYGLHSLAMHQARAAGCDDALMLDHLGHVVGCATANVFWVKNGHVFTPDTSCGCRNGVTRERVIQVCERLGISCSTARSKSIVLTDADEIFTTSSIHGIRRVIELDSIKLGGGTIATQIRDALKRERATEKPRA